MPTTSICTVIIRSLNELIFFQIEEANSRASSGVVTAAVDPRGCRLVHMTSNVYVSEPIPVRPFANR